MTFKIKKALSYVLLSSACFVSFTPNAAEAKPNKSQHHKKNNKMSYQLGKQQGTVVYVGRNNKQTVKRVGYADDLNSFQNNNIDHERQLHLRSGAAIVVNQRLNQTLYAKNPEIITPIASITKLMTAMITLDANLNLNEPIVIEESDVDILKNSSSRLSVGTILTRGEILKLALMSSENRAAASLARTYPGGRQAFFRAMNRKAQQLNMFNTRFVDSTGLDSRNVSTALDLAKLVDTAYRYYPLIRDFSTSTELSVPIGMQGRLAGFHNTNSLVSSREWVINLSKTGYINEAGRCLVMQTQINNEPIIIVLLDSVGKLSRIGDANRIKKWLEIGSNHGVGQPNQQNPNNGLQHLNVRNNKINKYQKYGLKGSSKSSG